jgi:hypothetical protein
MGGALGVVVTVPMKSTLRGGDAALSAPVGALTCTVEGGGAWDRAGPGLCGELCAEPSKKPSECRSASCDPPAARLGSRCGTRLLGASSALGEPVNVPTEWTLLGGGAAS